MQHNADGSYSVRADQADYEALNKNLDHRRHVFKANAVWDLPDLRSEDATFRGLGYVINDWQLSGVFTAGSGTHYDLGYTYNTDGANKNLTGSPDYAGRIVYVGDPGSGCSRQPVRAVQHHVGGRSDLRQRRSGVGPQLLLQSCPDHTVDLAIARNIRLGGGRQVQLRLDAFNAFNVVVLSGRQSTIQYNSPTNQTLRNSETLADGSVDPTRLTPRNAGFGAATGAQTMRNLQLTARFSF